MNFVDLGLPSGTLWADVNLGAKFPSEAGDFFSAQQALAKGSLPTRWQLFELMDECTKELMNFGFGNVVRFTGPNGNFIEIPMSGYKWFEDVVDEGAIGEIWSSTAEAETFMCYLHMCGTRNIDVTNPLRIWPTANTTRYYGRPVRQVKSGII